jgi:hypothetical protein
MEAVIALPAIECLRLTRQMPDGDGDEHLIVPHGAAYTFPAESAIHSLRQFLRAILYLL